MILVSLLFAVLISVPALLIAGASIFMPSFGKVTLWQVIANIGEPISVLTPQLRLLAYVCFAIGAAVFLIVAAGHYLLVRRYRSAFGGHGVLLVNYCFALFVPVFLYASFEYLDTQLDLRYEIDCLRHRSTLFRDELVQVDPSGVTFPSKKRNLIVIAGESLEESFADGAAFGTNALPRLTEWRRRHGAFGQMHTVHGADHTICALVGMTYGVPRLRTYQDFCLVSYVNYPEILLPSAWDVWLRNGFACKFVKGGSIRFACTDKVFKAVPGVELRDTSSYDEDPDYLKEPDKHPFGVNDEVVIEKHLRRETLELAESDRPFVLVVWTLNTHCPYGWTSAFRPHRHEDQLADAVLQTDAMVGDYLDWVEEQPFAENTSVVVIGDHTLHAALGSVPMDVRRPFNAVSVRGGTRFDGRHDFAAFDFAPTFLELTGAELEDGRFGIGKSLLEKEPTLLDRIGKKKYEDEIRSCGADFRRIAFGW